MNCSTGADGACHSGCAGGEIERYTTHLVRADVDESRAAHITYPIMMMLHGVVMHRLLNKKQSPLGRAIAAACLEACMTRAAGRIAYCDLEPEDVQIGSAR